MTLRMILAGLVVAATAMPLGAEVTVTDTYIAEGVENREPVNPGTTFASDLPHLWCLTRINGMEIPESRRDSGELPRITHVWYHREGDTFVEKFRIELEIGGASWRTRSQKTIQPGYEGEWKVEVLDQGDEVLATIPFRLVPRSELSSTDIAD